MLWRRLLMIGMSRNKHFINTQGWGRMKDMDRNWSNYFYSSIQMMMKSIVKIEDKQLSRSLLFIGN